MLALCSLLTACDPGPVPVDAPPARDAPAEDAPDGGPPPSWRVCDPLVPEACGLPFPNDVYTVADPSRATGLHLDFLPGSLPRRTRDATPFEALDGFSPASSPMTFFPGATATGLVGPRDIARSLEAASPTVLFDLTTMTRVAHFAEIDQAYPGDVQRALLLRPAAGLVPGHRYAVAIRSVVNAAGALVPPSAVFLSLRDASASTDPAVLDRRADYEALFSALTTAGVERSSLQIAWSFTVGSREAITGSLVRMRDETLAEIGTIGAAYTLTEVEARGPDDTNIAFRVRGTIEVPLYLTRATPGGVMRRDAEGNPLAEGTMSVPFWMLVPRSAGTSPGQLLQWGHGLLGSGEEIFYFDALHEFANALGYVIFAIDWTGMASEDLAVIAGIATRGDISDFVQVTDRLQQGILNALVAARTAHGGLASEPRIHVEGRGPIDTTRPVLFLGQSQGGIFGGTYMALTTDVARGVLLVPGQNYSMLLQRNRGGWDQFSPLFEANYQAIDILRCLALMQLLWDHAEPSGFTPYVRTNRLPGTPAHEVLMVVAINDHQVTTLAAHTMARTMGVPSLGPVNRSIWGVEEATGTVMGSAMIEIEFGVPEVPLTNTVPPVGLDPHTLVTSPSWVLPTIHTFFRTGAISTTCAGPCNPE